MSNTIGSCSFVNEDLFDCKDGAKHPSANVKPFFFFIGSWAK